MARLEGNCWVVSVLVAIAKCLGDSSKMQEFFAALRMTALLFWVGMWGGMTEGDGGGY
jgi:hypothetical protein